VCTKDYTGERKLLQPATRTGGEKTAPTRHGYWTWRLKGGGEKSKETGNRVDYSDRTDEEKATSKGGRQPNKGVATGKKENGTGTLNGPEGKEEEQMLEGGGVGGWVGKSEWQNPNPPYQKTIQTIGQTNFKN